jgi:hypothetical protein
MIPAMVDRHDQHYCATQQIDRLDPVPLNSSIRQGRRHTPKILIS